MKPPPTLDDSRRAALRMLDRIAHRFGFVVPTPWPNNDNRIGVVS